MAHFTQRVSFAFLFCDLEKLDAFQVFLAPAFKHDATELSNLNSALKPPVLLSCSHWLSFNLDFEFFWPRPLVFDFLGVVWVCIIKTFIFLSSQFNLFFHKSFSIHHSLKEAFKFLFFVTVIISCSWLMGNFVTLKFDLAYLFNSPSIFLCRGCISFSFVLW